MLDSSIVSAIDGKPKSNAGVATPHQHAAHPQISVVVDRYDDDHSPLCWVQVDGAARSLASGPGDDAALAAKQPQDVIDRLEGAVLVVEPCAWCFGS